MCTVIGNEFRLRNVGLSYDHPAHFTTSQWPWPRPVYLVYRFIMAGYTIFAFIHSITSGGGNAQPDATQSVKHNAMVYLTIWTYLLLTCHFVLAFIITVVYYFTSGQSKTEPQLPSIKSSGSHENPTFTPDQSLVKENKKAVQFDANENNVKIDNGSVENPTFHPSSDLKTGNYKSKLPWYSKISWLLANILSVFAVIVTTIFFGALFKPSAGVPFNDVNVHALNTVFILADNFISARPVRLLHVIYPTIYGIIYVIFSAIYWAVDNNNVIYKVVLDWNNPGLTIGVVTGIVAFALALHAIAFALYRLKLLIYNKMCVK